MKRTVGAVWELLGPSGMGGSDPVAVAALGVVVILRRFHDLEPLGEEHEGREEDVNVVRVNGDNHGSVLPGEPSSSVLVKVPGRANRNRFRILVGIFDESEELFVIVTQDVSRD